MPVKKKPGEKIYEDDPRYEQDKFEGAVRTWRDRLKRTAPEGGVAKKPPMGNATRTKDDKYTPPPKIENAVSKWKERKAPVMPPIHPTVGPTQTAKQAMAVRYNFTPEAAEMLHKTKVNMRPDNQDGLGGFYEPNTGQITAEAYPGREQDSYQMLAHEFGHKWFDERLTPDEQSSYLDNHKRWEQAPGRSSDIAAEATTRYNDAHENTSLYPNDAYSRGPEIHARVMERTPNMYGPGQPTMPGYMEPYFRGMIRGVPNPRPVQNPNPVQRMGADENGLMGSPPIQQWRNYW
jgi:hypothetical protein